MSRALTVLAAATLLAAPLSAQDVSAKLKGGTLVLTGQAGPEDIELANFTLADAGGQAIQVSHGAGTTINGSTLDVAFENVKAIKLDMGAGDDHVFLHDITLDGHVTLRGGGGTDTITIMSASLGSTKIVQGEGVLLADISGAAFSKKLSITGGTGDDDVSFLLVDIVGNLSLRLGEGSDSLNLSDVSVTGNTKLDLSFDDNGFTSDTSDFGKDLIVTGGPGTETLDIVDVTVGKDLRCLLDIGPNVVRLGTLLKDSVLHGDVLVKTGNDDDAIHLEPPSGSVTIEGQLKLQLGPGENSLTTSGAVQLGALQLSGGNDKDTVSLGGTTILDDVQLGLGGGDNVATLDDTAVQGDLEVSAGSGDDTLTLAGTTVVSGKTKVKLGGGTNSGP
jgi:hypothetical protein